MFEYKNPNLTKEEMVDELKKVCNEFTLHTRTGEIRQSVNTDIYNTILDLIISTIDEFQNDPTNNLNIIKQRIASIRKLIKIQNDYIKTQ